ncbi:MAG: (Fe-S)-binding protein [Thermodesulfobacteriota bacterium]|nr:(Fe-S)-binding protein [Thermodesulfobacteriota bacterium]
MPDMRELAILMKELKDQLALCMRCGTCQSVCPLFAQTGQEADVARGKLALLDGLLQEMFKNPHGVYDRLDRCLLCGSCAAACPSGVKVLDIFIKARVILNTYIGLSWTKKIILQKILSHPRIFDRLVHWGAKLQKLFFRPVNDTLKTSCARFLPFRLSERHIVSLAPEPFHRHMPSLNTSPGPCGIKVAIFVGCLIDKIYPHIARATLDVLSHHGVGVFLPEDQGCCGIPAISAGDATTFNRLVRHNLEQFNKTDFDYLITSCATCTSTIKKIWPLMLQRESKEIKIKVDKIAEKTMDISQFLVSKVGLKAGSNHLESINTVTYHDPCHLKKSLGVSEEPRALIQANPGYLLREMPDADACCGMGGSFNLQYYDISADIGKMKLENIKRSGCSMVATGCPACMIQLSDILSKSGDPIAVKHPVEIYAEFLNEQHEWSKGVKGISHQGKRK